MPIIDCHTYFGGSPVPGIGSTPAAFSELLTTRGIDAAIVFSSHARNVDPVSGNRVLKAVTERIPAAYAGMVAHTNRVDASLVAMRELMAGRKFVALALTGPRPDEPVTRLMADDILNAYRRYGKPLFLYTPHAGAVQAALEIARAYPMFRVVFMGMGGQDWRAAIQAAHAATNVVLETSGALDRAKLSAAIDVLGAHRLVFGSGSPWRDPAAALGLLADSGLTDDARRRICWDNARRLLGLDGDAEA